MLVLGTAQTQLAPPVDQAEKTPQPCLDICGLLRIEHGGINPHQLGLTFTGSPKGNLEPLQPQNPALSCVEQPVKEQICRQLLDLGRKWVATYDNRRNVEIASPPAAVRSQYRHAQARFVRQLPQSLRQPAFIEPVKYSG
jgi:hypothetical protein